MNLIDSAETIELVEIVGTIDKIEVHWSGSKFMESIESVLNQMHGSKVKLVESSGSIGSWIVWVTWSNRSYLNRIEVSWSWLALVEATCTNSNYLNYLKYVDWLMLSKGNLMEWKLFAFMELV